MREIKFRLRIGNKIVGYEKWYSGHQVEGDPCSAQPCWLYSDDMKRWFPMFPNYIPHSHKDQFTGLKDKNGVEIFEGDIANITHTNFNPPEEGKLVLEIRITERGVMKWLNKSAQFSFEIKNSILNENMENLDVEIIGNIYEHSKLLTESESQ